MSDLAHVFWVDNTPVGGDLVDLREGEVANPAECQFMSGVASSEFSIGFRVYHIQGVDHAGNCDSNSFMHNYSIRWKRGLNGNHGYLPHALSETDNHTDVGETGPPAESGKESFGNMLTDGSTGLN